MTESFDSGALSLDFAQAAVDDLVSLGDWLTSRFERIADDTTDRDLTDSLALRSAVLRLARARAEATELLADDIDTVNLFAATPDIPPAIDGGNRHAGRTRVRTGQALSTIARDAVQLIAHDEEGRIRECSAEDCERVFFDESRTNNRRWCSMQSCGNRAKVRAFRTRSVGAIAPQAHDASLDEAELLRWKGIP